MRGSLEGRVCIVTGPTSGIGRETARGLARLGARVVFACRNEIKGAAVRGEIAADTGNPNLEVAHIDLADPVSVRAFAADFQATHPRLDVLINNAGVLAFRRRLAPNGVESHFSVNVLGPFLLTNLLIPVLEASAPSRVINVGSATHFSGHVDFDNLQGEREYRFIRAYSNSKLEILLLTYELARRLDGQGVTVNCVHPGAIRTGLYNGLPVAARFVKFFLRSPKTGAAPIVRLASAPELQHVSGRYFDRLRETRSSPESYDVEVAARLWSACEALAGPAN
ncbi:MAG TPA: SDR family oxidoreductase [Thermoplasmata archaeon]|nr:SDR family oxidoreductase [Thermoplasmata archaeon]